MKITRVSLQSKLDELMSLSTHVSIDENNACLLQSKLDALIQLLHTYLLMKITRVSLQSKLDELMSLSTRISRVNVCSNDISSSRFDCSESRVIFINRYVCSN